MLTFVLSTVSKTESQQRKLSKCNFKGKLLLEQMEEMDRICPSRLQAAVSQTNVHTIVSFVNLLGPAFSLRPETALDTR